MLKNENWKDYEILRLQNGNKIERFGQYTVKRPESNAHNKNEVYMICDSEFNGKNWTNELKPWIIEYKDLKFQLETGKFKHVGLFPEQADNWDWMRNILKETKDARILNLFAYTGAATIAAAKEQAKEIVHVDALKSSIEAAKTNATLNNVDDQYIRYMNDDVIKFLKREVRRERQYTGIIMDPPSFGRGPKGELWKIKDELDQLIDLAVSRLVEGGEFLIINTYSNNLSKKDVERTLIKALKKYNLPLNTKAYDLFLPVSHSDQYLAAGQTVRWVKNANYL